MYPLFLSGFNETNFLDRFSEKYQIASKSLQCKPTCFMQTDGHDEANSRFSQFCERASLPLYVATATYFSSIK
jgi:hypothetical protein